MKNYFVILEELANLLYLRYASRTLLDVTSAQASITYAEEADVLNVAMFGMTAKQWREANPD